MCIKPVVDNQSFNRLQTLVKEKAQNMLLNERGKSRIEWELSIIQEKGVADVFLCLYDTILALKECGAVFHGLIHCSFLCYVLGISKVDPFDYGLPFERFYHQNKKYFPLVNIAVSVGYKEKALDILAQRNFTLEYNLEEAKISEYRIFTDEEIYQKTLAYFTRRGISLGRRYQGEKQAEKIFSKTDGRYIYQEQFFEICAQMLGVSNKRADEFRRKLSFRKKEDRDAIKQFFCWKLDEEGAGLFDYIYFGHIYVVSKAYIIGLLFLDFTI